MDKYDVIGKLKILCEFNFSTNNLNTELLALNRNLVDLIKNSFRDVEIKRIEVIRIE